MDNKTKGGFLALVVLALAVGIAAYTAKPTLALADSVSAGTATFTHNTTDRDRNQPFVRTLTVAWEATSGGAVTASINSIRGVVLRVVTDPAADAPTDDYDITLSDANGYDILRGLGANRDTATTESISPLSGDSGTTGTLLAFVPTLTLAITNAGSTNDGSVVIYYLQTP